MVGMPYTQDMVCPRGWRLDVVLFADELGGIHPEGPSELADRAPLGLRHVAGEGESYMGLFPRTVGKGFSRARTGAS